MKKKKFFSLQFLRKINILLPKEDILDQFDQIITPLLNLKSKINKKNRILSKTRDILLPKLINGEIDVSDLDIKVPIEAT